MNTDENTDPCSSVVSFCAVYADENPCRVAKDFRRSARRRMENPDASVKSPLRVSVVKQDASPLQGHCLNRRLPALQQHETLMCRWTSEPKNHQQAAG